MGVGSFLPLAGLINQSLIVMVLVAGSTDVYIGSGIRDQGSRLRNQSHVCTAIGCDVIMIMLMITTEEEDSIEYKEIKCQ